MRLETSLTLGAATRADRRLVERGMRANASMERMLDALRAVCADAAEPAHAPLFARHAPLATLVRESYAWCVEASDERAATDRLRTLLPALLAASLELEGLRRRGHAVGALSDHVQALTGAAIALARASLPPPIDTSGEPVPADVQPAIEAPSRVLSDTVEVRRLRAVPPAQGAPVNKPAAKSARRRVARAVLETFAILAAAALVVVAWLWISRGKPDAAEQNRELLRIQSERPALLVPGVFSARRTTAAP